MECNYTHWSAENATKAYLKTLKMGITTFTRHKEPDASEFISAIAAGNNAQLMVVACGEVAKPSTLLALVAAAYQTRGHVICIFHDLEALQSTKQALSNDVESIEFVIGDAKRLIVEDYKEADFVLNDCKLENHQALLRAIQSCRKNNKMTIVLGCNAFSTTSWQWAGLRTQLLPIGDGLSVTRIAGISNDKRCREKCGGNSFGRKSHWIVKVDEHTGEEHVFRVRHLSEKEMEA